MKRTVFALASIALVFLASPAALADSVQIGAGKDNTLYDDPAGSLSNGSGEYLFTGATFAQTGPPLRRGLVAFDVAGNVPAGATITGASLTLHMSMTISGPQPVSIHRVLEDWGEGASAAPGEEGGGAAAAPGDATWIHTFFNTDFWAAPGGDFVGGASATESVDQNGSYTWSTAVMAADVQDWLDNPGDNFGWIIIGEEATLGTAKRFDSRENDDPSFRPELIVEFTTGGADVPAVSGRGLIILVIVLLAASSLALRFRSARAGG